MAAFIAALLLFLREIVLTDGFVDPNHALSVPRTASFCSRKATLFA